MSPLSSRRTVVVAAVMILAACGTPAGGMAGTDAGSFSFVGNDAGNGNNGPDAGSVLGNDAGTSSSTKTCADYEAAGWSTTLTASAFSSDTSYEAYVSLNKCACVDTSTGSTPSGCADICTEPADGNMTPNFCNGAGPLTHCYTCIMASCSAAYAACGAH